MSTTITRACDHCGHELPFDAPRLVLAFTLYRGNGRIAAGDESDVCRRVACRAKALRAVPERAEAGRVAFNRNLVRLARGSYVPLDTWELMRAEEAPEARTVVADGCPHRYVKWRDHRDPEAPVCTACGAVVDLGPDGDAGED